MVGLDGTQAILLGAPGGAGAGAREMIPPAAWERNRRARGLCGGREGWVERRRRPVRRELCCVVFVETVRRTAIP